LASLLGDDDPLVRSAAARTSGGLGSASASRLEPLLADADPRVRLAAAEVLVRLSTHRDAALLALRSIADSPVALRSGDSDGLISVGELARRQIDGVQ
jgi:HEAT repeat protein